MLPPRAQACCEVRMNKRAKMRRLMAIADCFFINKYKVCIWLDYIFIGYWQSTKSSALYTLGYFHQSLPNPGLLG